MKAAPVLAVGALLCGCAFFAPGEQDPPVARIGDRTLTLAQLDERVRQELFDERTQGQPARIHDLRSDTLEAWIEELVLRDAAEQSGLSPGEWIASQTPAVSDEEIAAFYEENRDRLRQDLTLEQLEAPIRRHLEGEKLAEQLRALIDAADVAILLEAPRLDVAASGPSLGPADAPITIIEFSDFECPFCRQATPVLQELRERYPERLRIVYRHLPLAIHPRARPAAEASMCAHEQGHFWGFHDRIFAAPEALSDADLRGHAEALELSLEAYDACVAGDTQSEVVDADVEAARAAGIASTPAFLINGVLLVGAQPVEAFERVIERELAALAAAP